MRALLPLAALLLAAADPAAAQPAQTFMPPDSLLVVKQVTCRLDPLRGTWAPGQAWGTGVTLDNRTVLNITFQATATMAGANGVTATQGFTGVVPANNTATFGAPAPTAAMTAPIQLTLTLSACTGSPPR